MTSHAFRIGKDAYATGLFWQPLTGASTSERAAEIKRLGKELSFDLHVVRTSSPPCVGLAASSPRLRQGTSSAAAIVSKSMEMLHTARVFIFVAPLPDGHWLYVAQRDGVLLPDGDQAFDNEDDARSCFEEELFSAEWPLIFAPATWGIQGAQEVSFEELLPPRTGIRRHLYRWMRLSPADPRGLFTPSPLKIGILAVLIIAGGLGWQAYTKWQLAEKVRRDAILAEQQKPVKPPPPRHPWRTMPVAGDLLSACMNTMRNVRLFPGNWTLASITCTEKELTVYWKPQATGWIAHMHAVEPAAEISFDGALASITRPLPTLNPGTDETIEKSTPRLTSMHAAAQRYGVKLTATPPANEKNPPAPGAASTADSDWKKIHWKAEGVLLPELVIAALGGSGFRITSMAAQWNNGQWIWEMEGNQYVQL